MPYEVKIAIEKFKEKLRELGKLELIEGMNDNDIAMLLEAADSAVHSTTHRPRRGPIEF